MFSYSESILSLTLTILFILLRSSSADTQLIINTCKQIAKSDPIIPNYQTCVTFLQSDPKSATASLEGLGEIALKLTKNKSVAIRSEIKKLIGDIKLDASVKKQLAFCDEVYLNAESSLEDALKAYGEKDYMSANIHTSAADDAASDCEDGFKEKKGNSPLTQANNEMAQSCGISLVFTNMFQ